MSRGGHNFIEMVGKTFGELTVIGQAERNKHNQIMWLCSCSCGKEITINGSYLRSGHTKACGHIPTHCKWGHLRTPDNLYPNGTCKECQKIRRHIPEIHAKILIQHKEHYARNRTRRRKEMRKLAATLKLEALTHYGPEGILRCCWENCTVVDTDMLSLDHVNNDGAKHRRKSGQRLGGEKLYRWVIQENFPDGFQTLCMNHQLKKQLLHLRSRQT
jgi:hypothetical protein